MGHYSRNCPLPRQKPVQSAGQSPPYVSTRKAAAVPNVKTGQPEPIRAKKQGRSYLTKEADPETIELD
jgi:hypothetical protein